MLEVRHKRERIERASSSRRIIRRTPQVKLVPLATLQVGAYYRIAGHNERYYPWRFVRHQGKPHLIVRSTSFFYAYLPLPLNPNDWTIDT